ncbi:hypothetical protein DN402_06385 [Streptomyces sp. SW4]|nr:hypothetical protein DN402_06385 [Streptomyces sp. SW4]
MRRRREPAERTWPARGARTLRTGTDVTVVTWGNGTELALEAAAVLAAEGVDSEVVDLRWLVPLDRETVAASLRRTGRLVVVQEDNRTSSFGAGLVTELLSHDEEFYSLLAPPGWSPARTCTCPSTPTWSGWSCPPWTTWWRPSAPYCCEGRPHDEGTADAHAVRAVRAAPRRGDRRGAHRPAPETARRPGRQGRGRLRDGARQGGGRDRVSVAGVLDAWLVAEGDVVPIGGEVARVVPAAQAPADGEDDGDGHREAAGSAGSAGSAEGVGSADRHRRGGGALGPPSAGCPDGRPPEPGAYLRAPAPTPGGSASTRRCSRPSRRPGPASCRPTWSATGPSGPGSGSGEKARRPSRTSGRTGPSRAAGPSGPSGLSGPSRAAGPSGLSGPSRA